MTKKLSYKAVVANIYVPVCPPSASFDDRIYRDIDLEPSWQLGVGTDGRGMGVKCNIKDVGSKEGEEGKAYLVGLKNSSPLSQQWYDKSY